MAIGLVVARAANAMPDLPQPPGLIVAAAGAFAVLLILFRLIVVPDGDVDVDGVDFSRKIGIFLGLIAAAGITFGGWTAMNERASGQFAESSASGWSSGRGRCPPGPSASRPRASSAATTTGRSWSPTCAARPTPARSACSFRPDSFDGLEPGAWFERHEDRPGAGPRGTTAA